MSGNAYQNINLKDKTADLKGGEYNFKENITWKIWEN